VTQDIALTLAIILMAIILFATEKLRVDLVALLVLLAVSITGLVSKEQVFLGFANSAVITIWAVYIVSGGLFKTGVADKLGSFILRLSGSSEARLIIVIMLTCGVMSLHEQRRCGRNPDAGSDRHLEEDKYPRLKITDTAGIFILTWWKNDSDRYPGEYPRPGHSDRP
jgi:di/tricarboxylate transporter